MDLFPGWSVATVVLQLVVVALAVVSLSDCVAQPVAGQAWKTLRSPLVFMAAVFLLMVAGRFDEVRTNVELNPDESSWLAMAHQLASDPVPWRLANGGTSGPLTAYLVMAVSAIGLPRSYSTIHGLAALLQAAVACLSYLTIRTTVGEAAARIAIVPLVTVLAHTGGFDFVHLSSENVPLVLLAGAALAIAEGWRHPSWSGRLAFLAGVLLGAAPCAKLQAGPLAALLTLVAGAVLVIQRRPPTTMRAPLVALGLGILTIPLALGLLITTGGATDNFLASYFHANLQYGASTPESSSAASRFVALIADSQTFTVLAVSTTAAVLLALVCLARDWTGTSRLQSTALLGLSLLYLAVAAFCVTKPGHKFHHYLLFTAHPFALMTGAALGMILPQKTIRSGNESHRQLMARQFLGMVALVAAAPLAVAAISVGNLSSEAGLRRIAEVSELRQTQPSVEAQLISQITGHDDTIAVWGWRPDIYVESGRRCGVRGADTGGAILPGPCNSYARRCFLEDMERSAPALFIDAVCPAGTALYLAGYWGAALVDRRLGGHETFPELARFVSLHYLPVGEIRYPNGSIRIYERNNHQIHHVSPPLPASPE